MNKDQELLSDGDLDRLLAVATTPEIGVDFEHLMMVKIGFPTADNVLVFPQKHHRKNWLVGLPLAASLAFGLWLGASGSMLNLLPTGATEVAIADDGSDSGFEDIVSVIEGKIS